VLTLLQTGKTHLFPVVLVDDPRGAYWATWRRFLVDNLLETGMISAEIAEGRCGMGRNEAKLAQFWRSRVGQGG
ncbi:MAG: cytochrome D ubiquinol oxidase subunit II, partial [Candidatus Deferrimicrobiaceae bacterium]